MEMHGGQAIPAFDFYLAPFVRKTYIEEVKKLEDITSENLSNLYDAPIKDYLAQSIDGLNGTVRYKQHAINQTVERVHQSMEAFIHNMNTIHSRGGNQVVFSSINYGTDTSAEGRCIMREILKSTYDGVGNHATAIFPIQIWKKKRGVNFLPGDPNYDLYLLACKVTARRFFPNFLNLDATFNQSPLWRVDDPKRYEHEVATMGCVDGKEVVTYSINGETYVTPIEVMWKALASSNTVRCQSDEGYNTGLYINLSNVKIQDGNQMVDCMRIIRNSDQGNWMKVSFSNGRVITVTGDHPWSVIGKEGVTFTQDLQIGDTIEALSEDCGNYSDVASVILLEHIGSRNEFSYDVTTASEHFTVSGLRSHNCRTRVFEDRFGESTSIGRGNLSFSTLNLPGLALSVMNEEDKVSAFFNKLDYAIEITGKQLYERYQFQCTALAKQFPLLMSGMWVGSENLKADDEVRPVLKHGTLGVGFIGLAECLIALTGKHHGESDESQKLGLKIVSFMRDTAKELSDKYDLNFSVLATPAEGLSGKFTKKDKKKYGIIPGVTDKDYYTNSNHVPVYYHCSAAHKAEIEGPYHDLTRGGHIFYVEIDGDATKNIEAVKDIVNLIDKYNIGYGSINHNRNRCLDCGYEDAADNLMECPVCGSKRIDKLQRITGYLVGTTDRWNSAKLAELKDRVVHGK